MKSNLHQNAVQEGFENNFYQSHISRGNVPQLGIPLGISRGFLYNVLKASDRRLLPRVPPAPARDPPAPFTQLT